MAKQYGRPIATFTYSRRISKLKPGKTRVLRLRGKRVKVFLDSDGRTLKILDAPRELVALLKRAKKVKIDDGRLRPIIEKAEKKAPDKHKEVKGKKKEEKKPVAKPIEEPKPKPAPALALPQPQKPKPPKRRENPKPLTPAERDKAKLVPVPDKGPIPAPYIDWDAIPPYCMVRGVQYYDYPTPQAPKGMLYELREMFRRNRRYQDKAPVNVLILGPKGTGKSELIKKFAEDTGLPYWQVMGREGITADELLGHWELRNGQSVWVDGIIPKAVRCGGILHFDEANVLDPAILMRLDELLDNKRQLNMADLNGEIIKAHPDLFIIFTMNPPTYEGVKDLPDPIKSRLTKRYVMNYPPLTLEMEVLKRKMGLSDRQLKILKDGTVRGSLARDIQDLMKIVSNLRKQEDLSYTPSMRETQGFVQDLLEGDDFWTAFDRNIKGIYWGEEADRIEEALRAVRPRR